MGQKVNPIGLRLGINRTWDSRWYAGKKEYGKLLQEDIKIRSHLSEKLKDAGLKRVQVEGAGGSDWVLIDAGDIVVHLFKPEARTMYALEKMWGSDLDEAV